MKKANENPEDPKATPGDTHALVDHLADELASAATVKTVFGEPIERDGVTILPVARVNYGFGAGAGGKKGGPGEGGGGGGGVRVTPLGYIELKNGQSHFKTIVDPMTVARVFVVGGLISWLILRTRR